MVVLSEPSVDDDLCLFDCREPEGEAEALTRTTIENALSSNMTALRICFDRLYLPQKGRSIRINLCATHQTGRARCAGL